MSHQKCLDEMVDDSQNFCCFASRCYCLLVSKARNGWICNLQGCVEPKQCRIIMKIFWCMWTIHNIIHIQFLHHPWTRKLCDLALCKGLQSHWDAASNTIQPWRRLPFRPNSAPTAVQTPRRQEQNDAHDGPGGTGSCPDLWDLGGFGSCIELRFQHISSNLNLKKT